MLWGPVGLLLATPLTVCLVVLGKHIEALSFIEILLGDEPALEPEERFYQRPLAGDANEAADLAEQQLKTEALSDDYDAVPMKALLLAQADAAHVKLTREKQTEIRGTIEEIVEDLDEFADEVPDTKKSDKKKGKDETKKDGERDEGETRETVKLPVPILSRGKLPDAWQVPYPVLCIASRSAIDESACIMLAQLMEKHGVGAWVHPFEDAAKGNARELSKLDSPLVFLSYFGTASEPAHVRYLDRRLRRAMPHAKVMVGFWMLDGDRKKIEEWTKAVGADYGVASLREAAAAIVGVALGEDGTVADEQTVAAERAAREGPEARVALAIAGRATASG